MRDGMRHRRVGDTEPVVVSPPPHLWQRSVMFVVLLVSSGLLLQGVHAADRARPLRIGALTTSWGPTPQVIGLRDGLRELGYRDHEHFFLGIRFTQGDTAALAAAARKLVQDGADLLFADADDSAKAVQMATTSVPIVFAGVADPLGTGLVRSFASPGGNLTGVADLGLELSPKRLEIFRDVIPNLQRVLYLYHATDAYSKAALKLYHNAARALGMVLVDQAVRSEEEARATLAQSHKGDVDGILAPLSLAFNLPGEILQAAAQRAIPTMFSIHGRFMVEHGGLVSYGADAYASGRQAARLVEKISKGTAPAAIPVEVNSTIELVINLKVAEAFGYTIAPQVLYRADRLIR
jgi:putative tryptophan/tyrosine transport system substrate-binding protein